MHGYRGKGCGGCRPLQKEAMIKLGGNRICLWTSEFEGSKGAPVRQGNGEEGGRRQAPGLAQLLKLYSVNLQLCDFRQSHISACSSVLLHRHCYVNAVF